MEEIYLFNDISFVILTLSLIAAIPITVYLIYLEIKEMLRR